MVQELLDSELFVQQQEAEAGKAGCSWSAIKNEAGGGCSARRNLNAPSPNSVELATRRLKPGYLKRGPQGIMHGSTQARQDGI